MLKNQGQNKRMLFIAGVLTGIAMVVIYMTNRAVPFMMDDLWYGTKLYEETPITSLADIWDSQIWHYLNWGGRSITHTILQLTLLLGETAADILNVVVLVLLAYVICMLAGYRKLTAHLGAVSLLIGCNANWKMSMFWQSGAANYLYITLPSLLFLYCYLRCLDEEEKKPLPGILFWMLPLGLIAGWSNENMGPSVWLVTLGVIILRKKGKKHIPVWMILGNAASLIGSIMMIAAPGNFVRSDEAAANDYGLLWQLFLRGYAESKAALEYLFPVLLILGGLILCAKGVLGIKLGRKNIFLLLCALISWGAMVLSPHYPDRAAFGTMALLVCVILSLAKEIVGKRKETAWYLFGGLFFLWLRAMYVLGEFLAVSWGWIL